ncbi:response regulator [Rufibacter latericius]|uniref:Uncharacterized protein n=1 Tax=Rufibacter latericius TaxID=2487040 RepID=A0A3M9M8Y2_9BACT|nr:hypothetical protein [Rufibacter latericius]RNI22019.1 hypothetical protein EFB08_23080 [Rufibacter latericius]
MPVMDGFGFLTDLARSPGHLPPKVILLTSSENPKDLEKTGSFAIGAVLRNPSWQRHWRRSSEGSPGQKVALPENRATQVRWR